VPIRVKSGAGWVVVDDGKLAIKSGSTWKVASYVKVKSGSAWVDTGYKGYPTAPSIPYVEAWNGFAGVYVRWNPSSGGAPTSFYRVHRLDANGNPYDTKDVSAVDQYGRWIAYFAAGEDWQNQYYVVAHSAAGLTATHTGRLNTLVGHSRTTAVRDVAKSAGWNSPLVAVNMNLTNWTHQITVPADVAVSSWYINLYNNQAPGGWTNLSPGSTTTRNLRHVFAGVGQTPVLTYANPTEGWFSYIYWGQNQGWGWYIEGSGYSANSTGLYCIKGHHQIWGTRHWTEQETYETRAFKDNTAWNT
jgi:hypothetical protein